MDGPVSPKGRGRPRLEVPGVNIEDPSTWPTDQKERDRLSLRLAKRRQRAREKQFKEESSKRQIREQILKLKVSYKPHDKQAIFGKMIDDGKRIVGYVGGIRSGKSYAGVREFLKSIYKRGYNKKGLAWLVSPTYPMSEIIEREFENACDLGGGKSLILEKYVGSRTYLLVPPKGHVKPYRVQIKSAENPDRLRGASIDCVLMDEAAFMVKEAFTVLLGRILDSQGLMLITTTPKGMNWLYEDVYQRRDQDSRIAVVHGTTSDNPYLDTTDVEHLRGQYSVQLARQELGAEFVSFEGLVYPHFDFKRHVVKPIARYPDKAQFLCAIDAGYKDPFVCLWLMKWEGRYYVVDEYYHTMRTMQTHAEAIKGHFLAGRVNKYWMDPSAAQESAELANYKIITYPAQNEILAGINSVARMIETDRLFIAQHCVNTLKEMAAYQYPDRKSTNGPAKNTNDKPLDSMNHAMDALRYAIYNEEMSASNLPYITQDENGRLLIHGVDPDEMSNKLEDWVKMRGYNPVGQLEEDDDRGIWEY